MVLLTIWKPRSIARLFSCGRARPVISTRSGFLLARAANSTGCEDAGIVVHPLQATRLATGHIRLSASFGVFFAGRLVAHLYDEHGASVGVMPLTKVDPAELVGLETELTPSAKPSRISLHLEDSNGLDRGSLQEVRVEEDQPGAAENH